MTLDGPNGPLPYGDGSDKIYGMENFGNTCYCNSILQCLYYSEKFRTQLVQHNMSVHDRKETLAGVRPHNFTVKYEQLVQKRIKEHGRVDPPQPSTASSNGQVNGDRPRLSRKGSLFGIKFNGLNIGLTVLAASSQLEDHSNKYITLSKDCDSWPLEQRVRIQKHADFQNLRILVTRPLNQASNSLTRIDYSQASSNLLNNEKPESKHSDDEYGPVTSQLSYVVVGIPQPEPYLANPINPFNASPSIDQRKRSALINGPIINLDHLFQMPSEQSEQSTLLYALKEMFESMIENKSQIGVVSPTHFITKLKEKNFLFRQNNMHHDAHEFCNYLINETIESLNAEVGQHNNWCTDLFQGLITNETQCLSCETITSREETFLDLSIDIPPEACPNSLTHALNNFSKSETLTHQNKFYCNTCSSLQEATKTIKLKKLPEVLVINFKRFKYDEQNDKMVKLFDLISYPFKLRLFNTAEDKDDDDDEVSLYELYALVVHIGGGPMHGHYISLCKNKAGLWMLFDDETVEIVDDAYVMRFFGNGPGLASAYILFYQRVETSEDIDASIYNGHDYSLVHNPKQPSPVIPAGNSNFLRQSSISSSVDATSVKDFLTLGASSVDTLSSQPPIARKTSVFKKNFKFDTKESEKDGRSLLRTSSSKGPATDAAIPEQELSEKKSWVGGIKRRESRLGSISGTTGAERKPSAGSITTNGSAEKERKRSIFSFRRK